MTSWEKQEITGSLMRTLNEVHYRLSLALFKFHTTASYLDIVPAECFVEVETALTEAEEALARCRATLAAWLWGAIG
jgi:hypothetical protein